MKPTRVVAEADPALVSAIQRYIEVKAPRTMVLMVGGLIVIGDLIDECEYLQIALDTIEPAKEQANPKSKWSAMSDDEVRAMAMANINRRQRTQKAQYIHLQDVTIIASAQQIKTKRWRGRLDRIDGYTDGWALEVEDTGDAASSETKTP